MSRLSRAGWLVTAMGWIVVFGSCGGSGPVTVGSYAVPTLVTINPTGTVSLELGTTQSFSAAAEAANATPITQPITYSSSNPAVVTVASTGIACAGSWDSLTNPQICTPGPVGSAQITASAQGVTSPAVTVYTHQHVDSISISLLPNQNVPLGNQTAGCYSKGQTFNFQASAFSLGTDITSSVGPFGWEQASPTVASITPVTTTTPVNGLLAGQAEIQANVPGMTTVYATIGSVNSAPYTFVTCPVKSITLSANASSDTAFVVSSGTAKMLQADIFDTAGMQIYGVPLTWCSTNPSAVSVGSNCSFSTASTSSQVGATATASTPGAGNGAVTASCSPTACNVGFTPSMPVYAENVASFIVKSTSAGMGTLYVSSTGCGTTQGCVSVVVPVTQGTNALGSYATLPSTPNSMVFNRAGTKVYLGMTNGQFGARGVMEGDTTSTTLSFAQDTSVVGTVLGVSPDGSQVVVSDTFDTPNQVFIINQTTGVLETFQINGATAVDFSTDSLKAFILAGSTLYVYSKIDTLQTIALGAPAVGVSFLADSAFAYIAETPTAGAGQVETRRTCDNQPASSAVALSTAPAFIKALSNGTQVLALDSPNVDIINVTAAPTGCTPTVTNTLTSIDLGLGNFVPEQLIISADETEAYIVAPNLTSILVFDLFGETTTGIALANNAHPVQAALSTDGTTLYVAASDSLVHVLSTTTGGDIDQISFPQNLCLTTGGQSNPIPCAPNLIAFRP